MTKRADRSIAITIDGPANGYWPMREFPKVVDDELTRAIHVEVDEEFPDYVISVELGSRDEVVVDSDDVVAVDRDVRDRTLRIVDRVCDAFGSRLARANGESR